ncbi:MAG: adenylate/guanylate cyclase domain-containing protein [bacterium]
MRWPIKISIRLSILSIVLVLLLGMSFLIIGINYFVLDSVLIAAANNSLSYASGEVSAQISEFLRPLSDNASTAFQMFSSNAIKPEYSDKFTKFLYSLINDDADISGAYLADVNGNFYWLNKVDNGNYLEQITLLGRKNNRSIEKLFDAQGKLLSAKELPFNGKDIRLRLWYQQAKQAKQQVWIVYKFLKAGSQGEPLGITAAIPWYDSRGNLLGVFGADMLIETISKYVSDIKITKNSIVSVVDSSGNLISVHGMNRKLLESKELPKIDFLGIPWLKKSFTIYQQNHQSPFIYSVGDKKYISAYKKIVGIQTVHPWFVSIVTPIDDIIAPLRKSVLIAMIFICMILFLGVVLASILSSSISRPIRRLAQDANLICQLRLVEIKETFSRIVEIAEVEQSFMKMKNALGSFQRYMPVVLVKKLVAGNKIATVGGETKELTLIFTDIKNFTQISERINAQELMQYLSRYFQAITKVIIEMNGTVDKYMGDGLMAFWGAPVDDSEHALHTCQAVLQMQVALKQLNEEFRIENKPVAQTRVGISTGEVVVGNVGSDERLNYTLLGDPVNLASRLEGLNKIYGTWMIVSEFTYNKVKDRFKFRLLDKVAVKGKQQGVYIYELLGDAAPDLKLQQYNQDFFGAFSQYESGDWQMAINLFNNLDKKYPEDTLIKIFIERCLTFSANPPANWDGVWVMTEK